MGDPARLNMLLAMKYDDAVSAGELADIAGIARSTAREHLIKLIDGGLVEERPIGRWRYYNLADTDIAELLEGFEVFAAKIAGTEPAPPAAEPSLPPLTPQMLLHYFHGVGDGDGSIVSLPVMFSPPLPSGFESSSRAAYEVRPSPSPAVVPAAPKKP